jgi:hypothetical protein
LQRPWTQGQSLIWVEKLGNATIAILSLPSHVLNFSPGIELVLWSLKVYTKTLLQALALPLTSYVTEQVS